MHLWLSTAILGLATLTISECGMAWTADAAPPEIAVDDPETSRNETIESNIVMPFNVPLKTTGGTQVWTDHRYRDGYRLQQNALTGHWRVLDETDVRRTWGSREQCTDALDDIRPRTAVGQAPHYVILLHGLMRTSRSMVPLEESLHEAGYQNVIRFAYASTRTSIGDHAAALRRLIEDLPSDSTFSFVGHSMGNIVVRHLIGDLQRDNDPQGVLGRCRSMVMLGPPNQGASIARRLAPTGLYGIITGKGGMELGPEWDEFSSRLATPPFPFVIVAGDVSEKPIKNPLVDGEGDFIVSLEETDLQGREEFYRVPVLHSFLMSDASIMKICVDYIRSKQ